jgi:hypothetical protein
LLHGSIRCLHRPLWWLDAMTEDDLTEALAFSNAAAAICTEDLGAIDPMPHIQDVLVRRQAADLQTVGR